jgi:hypothetical protein
VIVIATSAATITGAITITGTITTTMTFLVSSVRSKLSAMSDRQAHVVLLVIALVGCKDKRTEREPAPPPVARDAAPPSDAAVPLDASTDWPELVELPRADAVRTIQIPLAQPDHPRFDVGGPVIAGELAIVSSSQLGFAAIDYRRGQVAWTKPAGLHVAPPLVHGTSVVLVGDCAFPPQVADGEQLLGCLRVVTTTGSDEAYIAIRGEPDEVGAFAAEKGAQTLLGAGERAVRWRRGEQAVTIDLMTGIARPASAEEPPLVVTYRGKEWRIRHTEDGRIVATGARRWATEDEYARILGVVWFDGSPVLRIEKLLAHRGRNAVYLIDMDATGSLRATVSHPVPGISTLGHAVSARGNTALAVRLDRTLTHDYVVAYAASALILYVYPLPVRTRADGVGLAVANDALLVFHDGETLTVLPEVSPPPTAPGASSGVSQNPTP